MPNITTIPAPRVPFIDERTGLISREWFRYLNNLFRLTGSGTTDASLADLEITPTNGAADAELPVLQADIQGLATAPVAPPPLNQLVYGAFHDMTRQTQSGTNVAKAITFDTTTAAYGSYRGSPTSRIYVTEPGLYNFQFSAQVDKTAGGKATIYFWPKVDNVDVPQSMSHFRVQGNDDEIIPAWNFVLPMKADGYFELMWAVSDASVILETFAATAFGPAAPSVILTVTKVSI